MPPAFRVRVPPFRSVHGLLILLSSALLLRLGGYAREWLPAAGVLLGLLICVHVADILWRHPRRAVWRDAIGAHRFAAALAGVGVVAAVIRLAGLGLDLGHQPLDIDEHRLSSNVKHYFVTGELRHDTVEHYPGLVFWLFSAASFISYVRSLARGRPLAPADVPLDMFVSSARMANVIVGVTIVVLTGLIGRRIGGPRAALLAALIVAIAPLAVELTLVRNDLGMVAAALAATYVALAHMNDRRRAWAVWGGALAGIAGAIKYSSVFAIVPVLLATWSPGPIRERLERAAVAIAAFVVAVVVTNHFMWYDFPNFLRQLSDQVAITGRGHWAATDNPASVYVMILDRFGTGSLLLLLGAGYAAYGLARRDRRLWIVLSFPILYLWFMTGRPSQFPRWVFPLLPFVAVAGCAALAAIVRVVGRAGKPDSIRMRYVSRGAAAAIAAAVLWQPVWSGVVSYSRRVTAPTHLAAENWIQHNVPEGAVILLGNDWLSLGSKHVVQRVPDLRAVLDAGVEQMAGYDWAVIPEPYFGHPTLRRLGFVQRFHASQAFGGRVGYDYEVYSIPDVPRRK